MGDTGVSPVDDYSGVFNEESIMIPLKTGLRWFPLGLLISYLLPCRADITLDGSMGPAGALAGPDFQIGAELGHQVGSNLFHSFGVFNINSPESATFSGPNSIDNPSCDL
jgi:hypothetical protein